MKDPKAIVFDLGGTVFDWESTVQEEVQRLATEYDQTTDSVAFAGDWGEELFRVLTKVKTGDLPWKNFDEMQVIALDSIRSSYPILDHIEDPMELIRNTWYRLKVQPGAVEGVGRLRERYTVVPLTLLSWASVVSSSKHSNIQWDGILSCEFLGVYKPSLQAYLKGVKLLGLEPHECLKVSYDGVDVEAAKAAGLMTAQLASGATDLDLENFGESEKKFDFVAKDVLHLCEKLGA